MENLERGIAFGDVHSPFEDKRTWALLNMVGRWFKPDMVVNLGDFLDCWIISTHSKDPTRRAYITMESEINEGKKKLAQVDSWGAKVKKFIKGNHEFRLERFIADRAPELNKVCPSIEESLRLRENGWDVTPYKQHVKIGKCFFTHDIGMSGKYTPWYQAAHYQKNVISGHTHRAAMVISGNIAGESHVSMTAGWLGNKEDADYARPNQKVDWCPSFIVFYMTKEGFVYPQLIPIVNYTCVVEGKFFQAPFLK